MRVCVASEAVCEPSESAVFVVVDGTKTTTDAAAAAAVSVAADGPPNVVLVVLAAAPLLAATTAAIDEASPVATVVFVFTASPAVVDNFFWTPNTGGDCGGKTPPQDGISPL